MATAKSHSPLRYPGGKGSLSHFLTDIVRSNNLEGGTYCELYAGGAGAALNLLFDTVFEKIHINDADHHIYCIWKTILDDTNSFIEKIDSAKLDIDEWKRQKSIFAAPLDHSPLDNAFSAFYLNRTNRSGIIFKAGPIGGIEQKGNYGIGVRFNKQELIKRVTKIASFKDQIKITNDDALDVLKNIEQYHSNLEQLFIYLDPPYYNKGKTLYMNNYGHFDHKHLSETIAAMKSKYWLISYDNVSAIKEMYPNYRKSIFSFNYTLQSKKQAEELLIFADTLKIPQSITVRSKTNSLILS